MDVNKTIDTVLKGANTLSDAISNVTVWLQHMVTAHGQQAVDLVLAVIRINALQNLIIGVFWLIPAIVLMIVWKKAYNHKKIGNINYEDLIFWSVPTILPATACIIVSFNYLLNIWTWVSLFDPVTGLAGQMLSKYIQ